MQFYEMNANYLLKIIIKIFDILNKRRFISKHLFYEIKLL
jgi:hypothetical protein